MHSILIMCCPTFYCYCFFRSLDASFFSYVISVFPFLPSDYRGSTYFPLYFLFIHPTMLGVPYGRGRKEQIPAKKNKRKERGLRGIPLQT